MFNESNRSNRLFGIGGLSTHDVKPPEDQSSKVSWIDPKLLKDFGRKCQPECEAVRKRPNIKPKLEIADMCLISTYKRGVISSITKQDILELHSVLAKAPGKKPETLLSPSRVNHVMTAHKQIVDEAADQLNFTTPFADFRPVGFSTEELFERHQSTQEFNPQNQE